MAAMSSRSVVVWLSPRLKTSQRAAGVGEAGDDALVDVVDVGVVAARGAVAELLDGPAFPDGFGEAVDGEVGALPRTIDGEEAQVDGAQAVEVRVVRAELFGSELGGGVGREGGEAPGPREKARS